MDALDRRIVLATQAGLPLVPEPYKTIAEAVGTTPGMVIDRLSAMLERGAIRRIGAIPNHYRLGYRANGMSVWNVDDDHVNRLGAQIGALSFVSHCYRRPRALPDWPYNLFAMVHGRERSETDTLVAAIRTLLGDACHSHDVLYSTRILKKTGLRFAG